MILWMKGEFGGELPPLNGQKKIKNIVRKIEKILLDLLTSTCFLFTSDYEHHEIYPHRKMLVPGLTKSQFSGIFAKNRDRFFTSACHSRHFARFPRGGCPQSLSSVGKIEREKTFSLLMLTMSIDWKLRIFS